MQGPPIPDVAVQVCGRSLGRQTRPFRTRADSVRPRSSRGSAGPGRPALVRSSDAPLLILSGHARAPSFWGQAVPAALWSADRRKRLKRAPWLAPR